MNLATLTCPACQYENIVVSCGFCLQCGIDIDGGPDRACEVAEPNELDQPAKLLADAIAVQYAAATIAEPESFAVRIQVNEQRHQVVHFSQAGHDEEVCIFSICGPAVGSNALPLLQWNGQLENAYFAVRTMQNQTVFVLMSRRRFSRDEVCDARACVQELARLADNVEAKISAGADRF